MITYELPFNEVVLDFYDRLKTLSRGYASLDYHVTGFWTSPLVKLDLMVNGEPVDALSIIVHKETAYARGRALAVKLRKLIPRQLFEVAIQATIGGRIIAPRVGGGRYARTSWRSATVAISAASASSSRSRRRASGG